MSRPLRPDLDALAAGLGEALPLSLTRAALGALLEGHRLSLCLHRVAATPEDPAPLRIPAARLDALLELLLSARPGRPGGWLTVSFDDGYDDAARYVASRGPALPEVGFSLFVCPEKLVTRAGFRWDLKERSLAAGQSAAEAARVAGLPMDLTGENARTELLGLADAPAYRLVTVEALAPLAALKNVTIGNHTSLHALATALPFELIREDYRRSTALLTRWLGAPPTEFAFPFGTPGAELDTRHVEAARALGYTRLWSTEARAYRPAELVPGALLPRCPIDGVRSVEGLAGWLAAKLFQQRFRRGRSFERRG
jgi:peptidoglycan/xylan/chitin deacetylase (PgdA/CDA1 family)